MNALPFIAVMAALSAAAAPPQSFLTAGESLWTEAGRQFLEKGHLPDASALSAAVDPPSPPQDPRAARQANAAVAGEISRAEEFRTVVWQARYVQEGPHGDEDYRALVDYVAARLGVDKERAEAAYLPAAAPSAAAPDPVLTQQLRQEASVFKRKLSTGRTMDAALQMARQLGDAPGRGDALYVTNVEPVFHTAGGQAVPLYAPGAGDGAHAKPIPTGIYVPPPNAPALSTQELVARRLLPEAFADYSSDRGRKLAADSMTLDPKNTLEECLASVKRTIARFLGMQPKDFELWKETTAHTAAEFAGQLEPDAFSGLHLRKLTGQGMAELRRVPVDLMRLPPGTILVYPPGTPGFSKTAGHIEIVTQQGTPELGMPTIAESDHPRKVNFYDLLAYPVEVYFPVSAPAAPPPAHVAAG